VATLQLAPRGGLVQSHSRLFDCCPVGLAYG
jgi:hypothetical protein